MGCVCKKDVVRTNTDASTTSDNNESETPGTYITTESDLEILTPYHEDNSVPDEAATTLNGEVKGRFNGLLLVPSNVVIKTKRTALGLDDNDLWNTEPYILYMASVATNTSTVKLKKRKRSETHDEASSTSRSARQRTF